MTPKTNIDLRGAVTIAARPGKTFCLNGPGMIDGKEAVRQAIYLILNTERYLAASQSKLTIGGTVKLVILDSTLSKPSSTLVELVQTTIDPTQNAGEGLGLAPIGHVVKVYGADEEVINLDFAVYCRRGLAWEDVCDAAADAVKDYFRELTQSWADTDGPLIVRVAQVESHLLTVPGILDVGRTALNGRESNLTLTSDHIPVLGTISAHAAAIS